MRQFFLMMLVCWGMVHASDYRTVPAMDTDLRSYYSLKPVGGLEPEKLEMEYQLERLNDFLCAELDKDCARRAEEFFGMFVNHSRVGGHMEESLRAYYAGKYYLHLHQMQENPRLYWAEQGLNVPSGTGSLQFERVGRDLMQKAHEAWNQQERLRVQLAAEEEIRRQMEQQTDQLQKVEDKAALALLEVYASLVVTGVSLLLLLVFMVKYRKSAK